MKAGYIMALSNLLFFCEVSCQNVSYATLYATLTIEEGGFGNFTALLSSFHNIPTSNGNISDLKYTTVTVLGTYTLIDQFDNELLQMDSQKKTVYLTQLSGNFSVLKWFNSLSITGIRKGSVIIDFQANINFPFNPEDLLKVYKALTNSGQNLQLMTEGLVRINESVDLVKQNAPIALSCDTSSNNFGVASWFINGAQDQKISNGTQASLSCFSHTCSLTISQASDIWRGTYRCEYYSAGLIHRAKVFVDVALLQDIEISINPQFPDCRSGHSYVDIIATCSVTASTEPYNVTWGAEMINFQKETSNYNIYFNSETRIICSNPVPKITCTFTNRKGQQRSQNIVVPVLYANSSVCPTDPDHPEWTDAKSTYTAWLNCEGSKVGKKLRECCNSTWRAIQDYCVNVDLNYIYLSAVNLQKGYGDFEETSKQLFGSLKNSTSQSEVVTSFADINTSVNFFRVINNQTTGCDGCGKQLNTTVLSDFLKSASNLVNESLMSSWNSTPDQSLPGRYLDSVEGLIQAFKINSGTQTTENILLKTCQQCDILNVNVQVNNFIQNATVTAFKTLKNLLPHTLNNESVDLLGSVVSVIANNQSGVHFDFSVQRKRNHKMHCVVWKDNQWSSDGCDWGGADNPGVCYCSHLCAFTILMSKTPEQLPFADQLTKIGLGVSITSLTICLLIEFLVWNKVVKSTITHFRHTALINISLCLLIADCAFLASPNSDSSSSQTLSNWCLPLVVLKHFCFLAMFFWMLSLSMVLLHSLIFIFHQLSKKVYLAFAFSLGYFCPFLIVLLTYISYQNGGTNSEYFSLDTCWLKYDGLFQGSIYAFIMPVGVIVFINFCSLIVVILKLLKPSVSEGAFQNEKDVIRSILKAVIFLTPIFGITWALGFFVLTVDLTTEPLSFIVNYSFILLNAFQGLFILIFACLGEKKVRDALAEHFSHKSKGNFKTSRSNPLSKNSNEISIKNK
ncbi:adhesion G-protein coupled receptor F3-like isoform X2 [Denticeps clupeoides]|uniref:adhesion G-protein coupled receptor F3-like isoform X2 n=1 Tax=Denticeps clupeoides TaxID=299321 RepID=UPI0010A56063|nr:adhesion G-protein coupled receptor F3-like isoform X2 [Denticeps clupeoides]